MYGIIQLQEIISEEINKLNFDKTPENLYKPVKYTMQGNGKRIRPALVLAACNLFSESVKPAIPVALAFEVFHNFTLLHDDIMDNSPIRRNKETVHKKWDVNTAILSGDAMMILAYEFLKDLPAELLKTIFPVFNETALQVCEGQQYDMDFEKQKIVSETEYIEMIRLKTSVLIAAALKSGALCGGADEKQADLLYQFGLNLGIAFQIQDDLLDTYADVNVFGKQTGNDIITEKKTFLLIKALELLNFNKREELLTLISNTEIENNEKIKRVKDFYEKIEIQKHTEQQIKFYYEKAIHALREIPLPDDKKSGLFDFAELILTRKK